MRGSGISGGIEATTAELEQLLIVCNAERAQGSQILPIALLKPMLKILLTLLPSLLIVNIAAAAKPACEVAPQMEGHLSQNYTYQVAGSGRLYFYSAPDEKCIDKKVFVIPGDNLTAYSEFGTDGKWTSVGYNPKDGDPVSGWVRTERLRFIGASGMNMTPEKVKFYQKAAEAAKAGRLGVPR